MIRFLTRGRLYGGASGVWFPGPVLMLAALVLNPLRAQAQVVVGRLADPSNDAGVAGAVVSLRDTTGATIASSLTDDQGHFVLRAPSSGVYVVRAERIGFRDATSDRFPLRVGETREVQMRASTEAVTLEGVVVTGERRCSVRPESALRTATVWDEARKALDAARIAERKRMLRYDVVLYERELDPRRLAVVSEERTPKRDYARHPFGAKLSAAELSRGGYIQKRGEETRYYAPDPNVLLSDEFLDDHCFRVESGDSLVGLAFEPVDGREVPDIEGVMWLDPRSSELRRIDYRYTRLPYPVSRDNVGGHIEIERLPNGLHIVSRWRIRMPEVTLANAKESRLPGGGFGFQHAQLTGIHETGGEVSGVTSATGSSEFAAATATLAGSGWDSVAARPLAGATIELMGTSHSTTTNTLGYFRMTGLPDGTYLVAVRHPRMDSLGIVPPLRPIELVAGRETTLRFGVPSAFAMDTTPGSIRVRDRTVGTGRDATISGRVAKASGAPIAGAEAIVVVDSANSRGLVAVADADGRFRLDGVPPGPRKVIVRLMGYSTESLLLDPTEGESVELEATLALRPVRIGGLTVESKASSRIRTLADGFLERRGRGVGFFIDRERIDKLGPATTSQILELAPATVRRCSYGVDFSHTCSVHFRSTETSLGIMDPSRDDILTQMRAAQGDSAIRPGVYKLRVDTGCPVQYYVDGLAFAFTDPTFEDIDLQISPHDIESVEIYRPSQVPAQFSGGTGPRCGVVVIWTRNLIRR